MGNLLFKQVFYYFYIGVFPDRLFTTEQCYILHTCLYEKVHPVVDYLT